TLMAQFHQEYLQMPRDSIRTLVMSAEKDAVKRFLSHMHQSWDQLQVETSQLQAMETMTAAFIHKFPRVTPELFVDLSQFIPFMSVSDIMNFPASLMVNDSVLTAIRDHSSGMKSLQKKAFVKRLLQSNVVGDVPTWPPYFVSSILPLLPYLPVSCFQQLTSQQVRQRRKDLVSCRLGALACYLDPVELGSYVQDLAVSSLLWQQLAQCMSEGFISADGRVRGSCSFSCLLYLHKVFFGTLLSFSYCSVLCVVLHNLTNSVSFLLCACGALQGSSQTEDEIDGTTLDILGPLLPFLDRESLAQVDRKALALRLEEIRGFCFPKEALRDIAALLTQKDLLGEPSRWQVGDVEHLGRLVFSLTMKQINTIPMVSNKNNGLKQFFKNILVPVPSCADIRGTFPSAWSSAQLSRMSQEQLKQCVEVFGQDASLSSEQRHTLWMKLRQSFSPVRHLKADQVLALGSVVTEMGERELQDLDITDLGVLAHVGTLTDWSPKKMRAVILGVMRKSKLKMEQLSVVELAAFGHLICGLPESFSSTCSMAVVYLREMSLPCTEQQMEALTSCLSSSEAFGPVNAWGPEVFTEIGTLAVGLPDMVLSALVQEQMEGITPEAIALMSPKKLAVVFSAVQLSWLTAEQAWAFTEKQWTELDTEQRHAVGLARYEGDVLLELRGVTSEK
uniref:Stereocilin LRR domain-containing protein n=1 Tax=Echeneis naucrates TaxID=173247 RepID=A0A665T7S1_ECHNA